ncbi:MAG: vWA domain-containing protein, partial [Longimicrobiales bacterium]
MQPFFDSVFSALFKYRPVLFEQGHIVFRSPVAIQILLAVALAATASAAWTYGRARGKTTGRERSVLFGVRCTVLALLTFALLRPTLVLSTVLPQQNYLAVLIDDSRSMQIADVDEGTRGTQASKLFLSEESEVMRDLSSRFRVRTFRFAEDANRIERGDSLSFDGGRTRIAPALERARAELASLPVAGVVVVSDGADNAQEGLSETLLSLKSAGIPVYTVGLGRERARRDLELGRVTVPRRALKGSAIMVELVLSQSGFAGKRIPVTVEDEGRILSTTDVELPADDAPATVQVNFTINDAGPRRIRFRVPVQDGELVAENNIQETVVDVSTAREKILYFEGEPRYELKFLRRAVAADSSIQLVTLQRTADKRYLRLDIDSANELVAGFPATREELFTYRALVLGSIEASYFSHDQL